MIIRLAQFAGFLHFALKSTVQFRLSQILWLSTGLLQCPVELKHCRFNTYFCFQIVISDILLEVLWNDLLQNVFQWQLDKWVMACLSVDHVIKPQSVVCSTSHSSSQCAPPRFAARHLVLQSPGRSPVNTRLSPQRTAGDHTLSARLPLLACALRRCGQSIERQPGEWTFGCVRPLGCRTNQLCHSAGAKINTSCSMVGEWLMSHVPTHQQVSRDIQIVFSYTHQQLLVGRHDLFSLTIT